MSSFFKEESGDKAEKPQQIEEKDDEKNEKPKREKVGDLGGVLKAKEVSGKLWENS